MDYGMYLHCINNQMSVKILDNDSIFYLLVVIYGKICMNLTCIIMRVYRIVTSLYSERPKRL